MELQPFLENESILLRPLRESDFDSLYKIAKDPLIWEQHPNRDRYQKNVFSDFFKDALLSGGALVVIDRSNDQIIGSSRFNPLKNVENAIEIGWSFLSRSHWGGEFNKSMKKLMINHAFKTMDDIVFYIGKDNIRSQKAVEKIGGVRITALDHPHLIKKNKEDWTYRINKGQWYGHKK